MSGSKADIIVGIPSFNNAKTIGHVLKAVDAGLAKYFPDRTAIIVNADGGSTDGTPDVVRTTSFDHSTVFLSSYPLTPVQRLTLPYSGIPGKGSALRAVFEKAVDAGAEACCVVDSDLRSITPEWIELLLQPVMNGSFDFVAPLYSRYKYDGTITNSIVYPMIRALFGKRVRQPIGGDFGFSGRMAEFYLSQDVWDSDVARFGVDIWMTMEALANGFNVCQTFLGAKIHDHKDPGSSLADMLLQVVSTLFSLTWRHHEKWREIKDSVEVPTFGFRYEAGVEPIKVNVERMLDIFRMGIRDLEPIWVEVLGRGDFREIENVGALPVERFRFSNALWTRLVYDYAIAFYKNKLSYQHLIKSLTPLYLGRTASFVLEVEQRDQRGAEDEVEKLCLEFEREKAYLVNNWKQEVSWKSSSNC